MCTAVAGPEKQLKTQAAVHSLVETMRELVGAIESLIDSLKKKFIDSIGDVGKTLGDVLGPMNALKPISQLMEKEIKLPVFGSLRGKETKSPLDQPYCSGNYKPEAGRCYEKCRDGYEAKTLDRCWSACKDKRNDAGLYCNTDIKNNRDFSWNMNVIGLRRKGENGQRGQRWCL